MKYKIITKAIIKELNPCSKGYEWYMKNPISDPVELVKELMKEHEDWANWLILRIMDYEQYVRYACYAAKQVLPIFEKKYPDDKRPRDAINAALKCAKNPTEENKAAAWSAVGSAWSAESAESAAWSAARSAWSAAGSAARSARSAAWSAELVAWSAAELAWSAAGSAESVMQIKILNYGIKLLRSKIT